MTTLIWEYGTAYDLFASLHVLHHPQDFGVRPAWAAGVRARLAEPHRATLARLARAFPLPFPWLAALPGKKDATAVLTALEAIPPVERLPRLFLAYDTPADAAAVLQRVALHRQWVEDDLQRLQRALAALARPSHKPALAERLDAWAQADAFGKALLSALLAYQQAFFAEEERRLRPALQAAVTQARRQAARVPLPKLLITLTQGVRFPEAETAQHLTLAPSFWLSPLVTFRWIAAGHGLLVFGGRPTGASLVPGEGVPDGLLLALRALADPTRLRILRHLTTQPATPTELARRLRLRPPTVVHHLHALRLARLVSLTVEGRYRRYAARPEQFQALGQHLMAFVTPSEESDEA